MDIRERILFQVVRRDSGFIVREFVDDARGARSFASGFNAVARLTGIRARIRRVMLVQRAVGRGLRDKG